MDSTKVRKPFAIAFIGGVLLVTGGIFYHQLSTGLRQYQDNTDKILDYYEHTYNPSVPEYRAYEPVNKPAPGSYTREFNRLQEERRQREASYYQPQQNEIDMFQDMLDDYRDDMMDEIKYNPEIFEAQDD